MCSSTKYSNGFRKTLVSRIENLDKEEDYAVIFKILLKDNSINNGYTQNDNGVFLNLSLVSDRTISRVIKYLNSINKQEEEYDYSSVRCHHDSKKSYKMTNYEKSIIKQRNLKQ